MNALSTDKKLSVIASLVEGNSIRSTERMTGVHRDTICRLVVEVGDRCNDLMDGSMRNLRCGFVQCDEICTYVGKKQRQVRDADSPEMGDQWVFVAMDAETKLVPVFTVGKRTEETTWYFIKLYGDYGQHGHERYSPSPIVETISKVRTGDPDPARICTSHIERQNLTMRMQMRRFTRLTNAFSKKLTNLKAACALHFAHYNFCRVHSSLRVTPAMAAGISSHVWEIGELIA
jgi:IS1 family transposase